MQHRSPVHGGQLHRMIVLPVSICACWVIHINLSIAPLDFYRRIPGNTPVQWSNGRQKLCPPSDALGGNIGSGPHTVWRQSSLVNDLTYSSSVVGCQVFIVSAVCRVGTVYSQLASDTYWLSS